MEQSGASPESFVPGMHSGTPWKDSLEGDGAAHASEASLRRTADSVVGDALRGLRRAFVEFA